MDYILLSIMNLTIHDTVKFTIEKIDIPILHLNVDSIAMSGTILIVI